MNKKLIRLTESDLHRIVRKSVNRLLKEGYDIPEFQVNVSETVNGDSIAWVSRYSPDGYIGMTIDTQYSDGADTTDWCVFSGSKEECDNCAFEMNNK